MLLLPDAWDFVSYWCDPPENLPRCKFQGDVFRGLRQAYGLTQAEAAGRFGVSRRTIVDWEQSRFVPSRSHIHKICIKFACPYWCLLVPRDLDGGIWSKRREQRERKQALTGH